MHCPPTRYLDQNQKESRRYFGGGGPHILHFDGEGLNIVCFNGGGLDILYFLCGGPQHLDLYVVFDFSLHFSLEFSLRINCLYKVASSHKIN